MILNKRPKTVAPVAVNPMKMDPTRSITLRRQFSQWLTNVFGQLKREVTDLIVGEDALGLKKSKTPVWNEAHEFASTQFDLHDHQTVSVWESVLEGIDPVDLIKPTSNPHVTVRYGLFELPSMEESILAMVQQFGPVEVEIRGLSVFEMPDSDILKYEVEGEKLRELNARLRLLPGYDEFDYNPHMTVATLRKGTAQKYIRHTGIEGTRLTWDYLTYSSPDEIHSHITMNLALADAYPAALLNTFGTLDWEQRLDLLAGVTANAKKGGNCGVGAGGFQPGNTCAAGSGGAVAHIDAAPNVHPTHETPGAPRPAVLQRGNLMATPLPTDTSAKTDKKIKDVMNHPDVKTTTRDVPINQIVARQSSVSKDSLKHFVTTGDRKEQSYELPVIVKVGKKHYLYDGTHRVSADALAGKTSVKASVYEMPGKPKKETPKAAAPDTTHIQGKGDAKTSHFFPVDEKAAEKFKVTKETHTRGNIETVSLKGLTATQTTVSKETVRDYMVNPTKETTGGLAFSGVPGSKPLVVEHEGKRFILDGHNRLVAAALRGETHVEVRLIRTGKTKPTTNSLPEDHTLNTRWKYKSQAEAAEAFDGWLKGKLQTGPLSDTQKAKWKAFIKKGFEKGTARAFDATSDLRKEQALDSLRGAGFKEGRREQFIRQSIGTATSAEKLRLLEQRALSEVKGLSEELRTKSKRAIIDGLVRGQTPKEIAEKLQTVLDVGRGRAETIAYTELVRAHADGQLEAMEQLGVTDVGVAIEWSAREGACPLCQPMKGVILKIGEAKGMIPRHPRCYCAWVPANIGEDAAEKKGQKRGKYKITQAVTQSQRREFKETGETTDWGPNKPITKKRPESTVFNEDILHFEEVLNRFCSTGAGGGVDPHCSVSGGKSTGKSLTDLVAKSGGKVGTIASPEVHKKVIDLAKQKAKENPAPTKQDVAKAKAGLKRLGANKYRRNLVGNTQDRQKRRNALLSQFGDGKKCPCLYCGVYVSHGTMEQDKIKTTAEGGKYKLANLVPSCSGCNKFRSDKTFDSIIKKVKPKT